ncbi:hypothetical protein ViNHUV68_34110 [Vibrio sp. NH-UV-68]
MNVLSKSKAVPYGTALLVLSVSSFSVEGTDMYDLSDYAQLACEVHTTSIQIVITTKQNTPVGSRITITGSSSVSTSLTPNSRLGLSLSNSDFPIELSLTSADHTALFTLNHQCKLTYKPT